MNTPQNDGGPAFPQDAYLLDPNSTHDDIKASKGMTLRDWFAGQAVSGLYADHDFTGSHVDAAKCSYALADAMLAARNERQEP